MKGSFTVEASFLVPFALYVIIFVLYVGFYWYDAAVCAHACFVTSRALALTEGDSEVLTQQQTALLEKTVGLDHLSMTAETQGEKYSVMVEADLYVPFVGFCFSVQETQWAYSLDQRDFIRSADVILKALHAQ